MAQRENFAARELRGAARSVSAPRLGHRQTGNQDCSHRGQSLLVGVDNFNAFNVYDVFSTHSVSQVIRLDQDIQLCYPFAPHQRFAASWRL
jgi:hypothetical protein